MTDVEPRPAPPLPLPEIRPPLLTTSAEAIAVAHDFARSIIGGAAERDRDRILPIAEVERFSATGLWAIMVPRDYGGPGLPITTVSEVMRIVSAADPSIGQIPQNHYAFLNFLRAERDEAKKRYFFGKVLDGYRLGNALVEMGTKTAADWKTVIRPDGDDFVIQGAKFYCTGALFAHFIPLVGRTETGEVLRAMVPRDAPGVTVIDDWSGFGQRTTASGSVRFEQVRVPASHVIGLGGLREKPLVYGPVSQIFQAAIDAGIAAGAFAAARGRAGAGLCRACDRRGSRGRDHGRHRPRLDRGRRGQGADDRGGAARHEQSVRACRHKLHFGEIQLRPALAERAGAYAA
jgi:alkylation response protein AidB-like acyl-CoA dehydrogenase